MNLAVILVVTIIGGLMGLVIRQQIQPGAGAYGLLLGFWVFVPLMPATLGMYFLPEMIGAKRFAFPRLNTLCFYLFALSALGGLGSILFGRIDVGWALDPVAFASAPDNGSSIAALSLIISLLIWIFTMVVMNLNIVITALTQRMDGLGWFDLPVFVWGLISGAMVGVLTLPVGFLALMILIIDRQWQFGLLDPASGGAPGVYRHAIWFAAHPALYNTILPAVGIVAVVLHITPHRTPKPHRHLILSLVALAALNSITWGVELMTSISPVSAAIFTSLAMLVFIPALIIAGALLGVLWNNGVRLTPPILYTLCFLFFAGNSIAAGLLLSSLSTGLQLFDTPFPAAHLHVLLIGSVGSAFFAGLLFWWPRIVGRSYNVVWSAVAVALFFEGVTLASVPLFVLGLSGVPSWLIGISPAYIQLQPVIAMGSWLLALGFVIQVIVLLRAIASGARDARNRAPVANRGATGPRIDPPREKPKLMPPFKAAETATDMPIH